MTIFWICVAIGVLVFGAMLVSMILPQGGRAEPATFHESTKLELLWTVIPIVILVVMAYPATDVLVKIYDTGGEDMVVEVRGYQWKWQYKYLDEELNEQVSFFSNLATPRQQILGESQKGENYLLEVDNELVIPTDTKVRFLLTSNDVIHSWWVPDFGLKAGPLSPASLTKPGLTLKSRAYIAASARNCAARITAVCPWWCAPCPERRFQAVCRAARPQRRRRAAMAN